MTNAEYETVEIRECGEPLVSLADFPLRHEPVYYHDGLSNSPDQYARESVALKLMRVQDATGLRVKVWDAWRPRSVQGAIYRAYEARLAAEHPEWRPERLRHEVAVFVTYSEDPARIPPHATGGSVDLTLVGADGEALDMGTGFDHFGAESARDFFGGDTPPGRNRALLADAMVAEGFLADPDEWWHFDYGNQLWALELGKDCAVYGEVVGPVRA